MTMLRRLARAILACALAIGSAAAPREVAAQPQPVPPPAGQVTPDPVAQDPRDPGREVLPVPAAGGHMGRPRHRGPRRRVRARRRKQGARLRRDRSYGEDRRVPCLPHGVLPRDQGREGHVPIGSAERRHIPAGLPNADLDWALHHVPRPARGHARDRGSGEEGPERSRAERPPADLVLSEERSPRPHRRRSGLGCRSRHRARARPQHPRPRPAEPQIGRAVRPSFRWLRRGGGALGAVDGGQERPPGTSVPRLRSSQRTARWISWRVRRTTRIRSPSRR